MNFWQTLKTFSLLAATIAFSGCAIGTRRVSLGYEPYTTGQARGAETVALIKFADVRQRTDVGEVRNGYGIKTASVKAEGQDVGAWVANALAEELARTGLTVRKYSDVAPPGIDIVVSGSVSEAYVKTFLTYRTRVKAKVSVARKGVPLLSKEYLGKSGGLALTLSASSYERRLEQALQDLMKQAVPDILGAI